MWNCPGTSKPNATQIRKEMSRKMLRVQPQLSMDEVKDLFAIVFPPSNIP
jgi:hypothetical protein